MAATETTTQVTGNGEWHAVYERLYLQNLVRWSDEHEGDLDAAVAEFTKQCEGKGWYGTQSPFMNALSWRGEDLAKAEVSTWVALAVKTWLPDVETGTEVEERVQKGLAGMQASGLRDSSSSRMSNTLSQLRGVAALEFGSGFGTSFEQCKWQAHFDALRELAAEEQRNVDNARTTWSDLYYKLDRARAESTVKRLTEQLATAEMAFDYACDLYVARMQEVGGPTDRPVLRRGY
jgi:hypothetical protein